MNVISLYYHVFITSDSKATMLLEMYLFQHWSNCMFQQMKADKTGLNVSYRMVSISALITIHDHKNAGSYSETQKDPPFRARKYVLTLFQRFASIPGV